jgi:metal-responsive CopG/Arc/MetJ family transcriptional regulator
MGQINLRVTEEFEQTLARFMRVRGIRSKSEAIRAAIREGLQAATDRKGHVHFRAWLGAAAGPGENPNPRFKSDDELWR